MNKLAIDNISHEEFEKAIQEHITWASEWDGALPADVFFGLWADLHRPKQPLELKAHLIEGQLKITAPPYGPVKVVDNRIYLEDGLELIINLE